MLHHRLPGALAHTLPLLLALTLVVAACQSAATPTGGSTQAPLNAGASSPANPVTLTVFAATSLVDAFDEIGAGFMAVHPGTDVVFNFAGSHQLATQISQGAPVDVFAAANEAQMQVAIASGRIVSGTQQTFVRNRLVVVTPGDNPARLAGLPDLARPGVKLVLAAKEVPVGQYALDFLAKAEADGGMGDGYEAAVLANVVSYEENVRAVLAKVALGEADAGIVYTSDAAVSGGDVHQIAIPDALNTIAQYPLAVLADSPHAGQAQAFVAYVLGPEGQQVLQKYGFSGVGGE